MNANSNVSPDPTKQREFAYTTPRPDIFALVPSIALSVLDVGCSNGALGASLKAAQNSRSVWGIEYDRQLSNEAVSRLDRVILGDLNQFDWDVELGTTQFDCIIFADVLEHLVNPALCLSQACSHLYPGGSVIVSLPNIRHLSSLHAIFIDGHFPRRDRGIFDRTHLRWFTIEDGRQLLLNSGLQIIEENLALRWGDIGGGRLNRALNRLPKRVQNFTPIRELLTYQTCFRAELPK